MRSKVYCLGIVFFFSCFFIIFKKNTTAQSENPLVVHEWGTFTTLSSSKGELLEGLYLDEETLPDFVYEQHDYPTQFLNTHNFRRGKGVYFEPLHVTVKMETPVIYFYTAQPLHASVQVDFPNGFIGQWFPACTSGNKITEEVVDFTKPVKGFMNWEIDILSPETDKKISHEKSSHTWETPRNTDANLISAKSANATDEIEKFIFYRGIANFTGPLTARFARGNYIEISNTGNEIIPYVFVYEKDPKGNEYLYWQGEIKNGEQQVIDRNVKAPAEFTDFESALIKAGLYEKEAKAMLDTWKESYFEKAGIRIFWIVPENWVNKVLPLKVSPQPAETKRVFVGRYEILAPEFETTLLDKMKENKWFTEAEKEKEKFYLAYEELVQKRLK